MNTDVRNLIIIGSGPAGYTAALYAARANLEPLVFEGIALGGALMNTTEVENFPGFPEGIMGPKLMEDLRNQAEKFGAELLIEDVIEVDLKANPKVVKSDSGTFFADAVILSTGSEAKYLGVDGEERLQGRGVSACATCDGFFFKNQKIVVVGGGDSAMEEANFLTTFASEVTLIHRREEFKASDIMLKRVESNPKIKVLTNTVVNKVLGEDSVTGVEIRNIKTDKVETLDVTGFFVAIGHNPRSELFVNQVDIDPAGYVKVEDKTSKTNIVGVFAAGDLTDPHYQQAITAAGSGCIAALDAQNYLTELKDKELMKGLQNV